jgi:chromosome segregation ATPase
LSLKSVLALRKSFAIVIKMKNSCLLLLKQGWLGLPLFFLGLVTLAFSQLENEESTKDLSADQLVGAILSSFSNADTALDNLKDESEEQIKTELSEVEGRIKEGDINQKEQAILLDNLNDLKNRFQKRSKSMALSVQQTNERITGAKEIFRDLQDNFAGRMEEARSALLALHENLSGSLVELEAMSTMSSGLSKDFSYEVSTLSTQLDEQLARIALTPPVKSTRERPTTSLGRKISSIIQAHEALPLRNSNAENNKIILTSPEKFGKLSTPSIADEDDLISKLRKELNDSKDFQTELSADSSELKSDLRKAYREIVSLQTNLKESKMIVEELENSKRSLYNTSDGGPATAQTVSREINRLERDLEQARDDLRQSRQSLLLEQQRSNAMISSVTTELERTRRELDYARQMAHNNSANFERLSFLERELAQAKRALESVQTVPLEPGSEDFVNLQEELRKSLGEIARMQIELSEKNKLQDELLRLKSMMEQVEDTPSRSASPVFVNKLLVELNAANDEIERLQNGNIDEREGLSADVITLQDQLHSTQSELDKIRQEFANTKEDIATREFEFASTIKKLEEEAQKAESVLQQAAEGRMPVVPFVTEMEENLASSESRIRLLSDQFANEQKRASEVIEELTNELDLAQARHKQSLDQLARRELELTNKDQDVSALSQEKKDLEEELKVVKVITGQLQDLNKVLEDTKESQSVQSQTSDQVLDSLKDELNRAKIDLVVTLEDKEKLQDQFSQRLRNLEMQLEEAQNEIFEEQEIFQDTTNESKILVAELKTELDAARLEIAQMKRSGISESVGTKQAVSQLQEALGTIRILQESLQEAEASNLEVDNLRTELADAMSGQLEKFRETEDEKNNLHRKIQTLESEIAVLRESNNGSQLAQLKLNAGLQDKLDSSEGEIIHLTNRLSQSEQLGVGAIVSMEDELASLKNQNDELRSTLLSNIDSDKVTIEALQNELTDAKEQLSYLQEATFSVDERLVLKNQNNRLSNRIKYLQDQLSNQLSQEFEAKSAPVINQDFISLQMENDALNDEINRLENILNQPNLLVSDESPSMLLKAMDLEMKLEMALAEIEQMAEDTIVADEPRLSLLENELAQANLTINELNLQIEAMISRQAEAELDLAMIENSPKPDQTTGLSSDEKAAFVEEIKALRDGLNKAKEEAMSNSRSPDMLALQNELRQAVAESFELQMELEQTQVRLKQMEDTAKLDPSQESIDEISRRANDARESAQSRIDELSSALRNSELLRSETEDLVTLLERKALQSNDISNDPRFIELQQEMLALQNDLISIQEMTDPRVKDLEDRLQKSQAEGSRLNGELSEVVNEFSSLKSDLATIENENRRLRDVSLTNARNQANDAGVAMQNEINNLTRENTSLSSQVNEKDARIRGLRDELSQFASTQADDFSRNRFLQMQVQLQEAEDARNQAKLETQRIREELVFANRSLTSLQSRMRDFENDGLNKGLQIDPLQIADIQELTSQNKLLKEQLATMSALPARDDLQDRIDGLNQRNLSLTVELDQERIIIDDLKNELTDARAIKQEFLERGKSSKLKVELLNDELSDAKIRVTSLEKALVAAREAIRVLQGGGNQGSMIQVSNRSSFSNNFQERTLPNRKPFSTSRSRESLPEYSSVRPRNFLPTSSNPISIKNDDGGEANLQIQAKVQFLDNKIRPAGFTEFFLVDRELSEILNEEGIKPPLQDGIQTHAEYWARSVQRGYQFPGIAAKIRNALARASLRRIKTNSLGVGNVDDLSDGNYFIVGASTLGQVGVVWSKPLNLINGDNIMSLDLKDAAWAQ